MTTLAETLVPASDLVDYLNDTARALMTRAQSGERGEARYVEAYNRMNNERAGLLTAQENFIEALKQWADNEGSDSDFDDVLERFGFERRSKEYRVRLRRTVTYTQYVTTTVTAQDDDRAAQDALEDAYELDWETDYDSEDTYSPEVYENDEI